MEIKLWRGKLLRLGVIETGLAKLLWGCYNNQVTITFAKIGFIRNEQKFLDY
jgi:hypothetical protein